jgi:hypothetical protein
VNISHKYPKCGDSIRYCTRLNKRLRENITFCTIFRLALPYLWFLALFGLQEARATLALFYFKIFAFGGALPDLGGVLPPVLIPPVQPPEQFVAEGGGEVVGEGADEAEFEVCAAQDDFGGDVEGVDAGVQGGEVAFFAGFYAQGDGVCVGDDDGAHGEVVD